MNHGIRNLGLPIVLMGSLWSAVNTTVELFKVINERRDMVFGLIDDCGSCPDKTMGPLEIYLTNVLPVSTGACIFLFLISYVVVSIPTYLNVEGEEPRSRMIKACYMIASLPLFALFAFVLGGIFDATVIIRAF